MSLPRIRLGVLLAFLVLPMHAVVLGGLYLSLGDVLRNSHETLFVQQARSLARVVAEQLEITGVGDPRIARDLIDSALLGDDGVFAQLSGKDVDLRSELNSPEISWPGHEDFRFGEHGDSVYFIELPMTREGQQFKLRLGFDERPTTAIVADARRSMLWTLSAYLGASALLMLVLGLLLARPLRRLQADAYRVTRGEHGHALQVASYVREVDELAQDLERMRLELLGTSERLRAQMAERERSEELRAQLERQLQHRERLDTVGTLAGGMAHEINNALVPITLLTGLALREASLPERARGDLTTVLAAARQARNLVQKILTFSRSLDDARPVAVDLGEVVQDALRLFRPLASRNVTISVNVAEHCRPVMADRALLMQLVMNLCTNAYQSLQHGEGRIGVRVSETAGQGTDDERVALEVSDTGQGMDEATIARAFEPFYTTRAVGEGTGLGLSVVHGIVQGFGASIEIESRLGHGSTFRVLFPPAPAAGSGALLPANEHVE